MIHDKTTTMLFKLPLSLKEQLLQEATNRNISASYILRLGITQQLGLPDEAADMTTLPTTTPEVKRTRNTERKRKARRIQRQLATLAPEVLNTLLERRD